MKRTLTILSLVLTATTTHAAIGDVVNLAGLKYVADGVKVAATFGTTPAGSLSTNIYRADSTRFYDSTKGAGDWVKNNNGTTTDHLLCWAHAAANVIEYWQSYYGVFATPQTGDYFDGSFLEYGTKPLPYGKIGTETANYGAGISVPDSTKLAISREMYYNMNDTGGRFKYATEWFFKGDISPVNDSNVDVFKVKSLGAKTGGYYADYFNNGPSYTTVYSEYTNTLSPVHTSQHTFATDSIPELTQALLPAFGLEKQEDGTYLQTESGKIAYLGIWTDTIKEDGTISSTGHMITCYGFTTDADGNLATILIANSDDKTTDGSGATELIVKQDGNRIKLYSDNDSWLTTKGYYIGEVSYLNTPEVLKNMLAEYSNTEDEAQVWNGSSSTWAVQTADTNVLPTEATGWDVLVDGNNIDSEHRGYYHTYATDGRSVEFGAHAAENQREVTIVGTVSAQNIDVTAAGYRFIAGEGAALTAAQDGSTINIRNGASLTSEVALTNRTVLIEDGALLELTQQASVQLRDVTLQGSATISAAESGATIVVTGNFTATSGGAATPATFALRSSVTPEPNIYADLDLTGATSVTLDCNVNMNGHDLHLAKSTPITLNLSAEGAAVPFFSNIGKLFIEGQEISYGTDLSSYLTITNEADFPGYTLSYADDMLSMPPLVPEPTTTTLGVLALAALAARRRRR